MARTSNPHSTSIPPGGGEAAAGGLRGWVLARPVLAYLATAFALTALAAVVVYGPTLLGHDTPSGQAGRALAAFPIMVIGVGAAGITLTTITAGQHGRRQLWARMRPGQATARWYAVALLPPAAILTVLLGLRAAASTAFTPGRNPYGLAFGLLAGFSEELGWTGYVWPRLRPRFHTTLGAGVALGLLWGLWHLPVIDHLGVHPHGVYWAPFAAAFIAAVAALRVLIAWTYSHTGSVGVAQLLHASSTGSLVLLSPLTVTPAQEALWYAGYALALWAAVAAITYLDPSLRAPSGGNQTCPSDPRALPERRHLMSSTSNPHPRTIPLPAAGGRSGRPQAGGLLGRVSPNSRTHWTLLLIGLVGSVAFNAIVLIDGLLRPGYDWLRQPMSALSLGPGGWVQVANFIGFGILGCVAAFAWRPTLTPGIGAVWYPRLRVLAGLAFIGAGLFTPDPGGGFPVGAAAPATPTTHAVMHNLVSYVSLTVTVAELVILARRFAHEPGWAGLVGCWRHRRGADDGVPGRLRRPGRSGWPGRNLREACLPDPHPVRHRHRGPPARQPRRTHHPERR